MQIYSCGAQHTMYQLSSTIKSFQKQARSALKTLRGASLYKKHNMQEKVVSNELALFISSGIYVTVIGNYMEKERLRRS